MTLPAAGGNVTQTDSNGAKADYGPATIFGGIQPANVTHPRRRRGPSRPRPRETTGPTGSASSSVDIVLNNPANPAAPGGFGPPPLEGQQLHVVCSASAGSTTGSTNIVNGTLTTSTEPTSGDPVNQEAIPANPPVNYTRSGVINNVGVVFTVVFNQQIINADGSLTVNAVHSYLFGPTAVGEEIIGQVTCGTNPSSLVPNDTQAPTCGAPLVLLQGIGGAPRVPQQVQEGIFDAQGIQTIDNIQTTNATVQVGQDPASSQAYLRFTPGQTGPLDIIATETDANLPTSFSFDATDTVGNKTHVVVSGNPPVDDLDHFAAAAASASAR